MEGLMRKPKILAVNFAFPPMALPRSIQVSRLLKSLDASIVLVCGEDQRKKPDHSIAPEIEHHLEHVFRIPFYRSILFRFIDRLTSELHIPWSDLPDVYRKWNLKALKHFLEWQETSGYRPDAIMTFGQPMSDHLFGLKYKKRTTVPWIAHFSDPWVDNPYRRDNPFTVWINRRMEGEVVKNVDALVFTSPETIDLVMKKYPFSWRKKAFCLPHCYDETLYDRTLNPPSDRYVIRSIGKFYGPRSPKPIFEAVEQIALEKLDLFSGVVIEFVGPCEKFNADPYPLARKVIHFIGEVSYVESLRLMQTAHCLLVIDAPATFSVFFPSKLVDYIGAGRFIVAISPPGATSRVVKDIGGWIADPLDPKSVIHVLKEVLKNRLMKLPLPTNRYEKEIVSKEMIRIIEMTLYHSWHQT
jgi:glycosyltransferase involved in cell wall biosynthesis